MKKLNMYFPICSFPLWTLPVTYSFGEKHPSVLSSFFFFNFWLRWVFVAVCRLSLVAASRVYSSLWCAGFSLWWLLLLQSTGSRRVGSLVVARGL